MVNERQPQGTTGWHTGPYGTAAQSYWDASKWTGRTGGPRPSNRQIWPTRSPGPPGSRPVAGARGRPGAVVAAVVVVPTVLGGHQRGPCQGVGRTNADLAKGRLYDWLANWCSPGAPVTTSAGAYPGARLGATARSLFFQARSPLFITGTGGTFRELPLATRYLRLVDLPNGRGDSLHGPSG